MRFLARIGETEFGVDVEKRGSGRYAVSLDGVQRAVERRGDGALIVLALEDRMCEAVVVREAGAAVSGGDGRGAIPGETPYSVVLGGKYYSVRLLDPLRRAAAATRVQEGPIEVRATMPGKIAALLAREGQEVKAGQGVVVVEAMKMENELPAPKDGRVARIRVRPGETVEAGAALFTVE